MGSQFGETAYISDVNRGSHEHELGPRAESFSLGVAGEDGAPNCTFSKLPELSKTSRAWKLIFGLQVNIDKANSRRYHVTW